MLRMRTLLRLMRFWPPFLGAGIKVTEFNKSLTYLKVEMRIRWWNKNYMNTHFGGSLYSMTDPFYMLMLIHALGKGYEVWDKAASIRYKKPAKSTVSATFQLDKVQIEQLKKSLAINDKIEPEFTVLITDESNVVVAEVKKILHIKVLKKF